VKSTPLKTARLLKNSENEPLLMWLPLIKSVSRFQLHHTRARRPGGGGEGGAGAGCQGKEMRTGKPMPNAWRCELPGTASVGRLARFWPGPKAPLSPFAFPFPLPYPYSHSTRFRWVYPNQGAPGQLKWVHILFCNGYLLRWQVKWRTPPPPPAGIIYLQSG